MSDTMASLDDIFAGREIAAPPDGDGQPQAETVTATEEPETGVTEPEPGAAAGTEVATPATDVDDAPTVPRIALIDERRKRQDAEARANDLAQRLAAVESRVAEAPEVELPDAKEDPDGYKRAIAENRFRDRFNIALPYARRAYGDLDQVMDAFHAEAAEAAKRGDHAMAIGFSQAPDPVEYAYRQGKIALARREIGDDPVAFRERVRAEIKAEMEAEAKPAPASAPAPTPSLPKSLASAPSSVSRSSDVGGFQTMEQLLAR